METDKEILWGYIRYLEDFIISNHNFTSSEVLYTDFVINEFILKKSNYVKFNKEGS